MKTRRALLLTAAPGLALAACGQAAQPTAQAIPPTTIEYAYNSGTGALAEARAAGIPKFMAKFPNITVNQVPGQPEAVVLEKFKASAAAGTPPDVISLNANVFGDLVASKFITALDDLAKSRSAGFSRDAFHPEPLNAMTLDGKLYGVPRFVTTMLLFYNKDLFQRAGIAEPNENWTYDKEFADASQRLATLLAGEQGFPFLFSNDLRNTAVYSWGGEFFDKPGKKSLLDQPAAISALETVHGYRFRQRFAPAPGQDAVD